MQYSNRTFWALVLSALSIMAAPWQVQARDCESWLSVEFFKTATNEDVKECVGVKENPKRNWEDKHGLTPLHFAVAINEDPEVIVVLMGQVELNSSSSNGWTPLHIAARYNANPSVIEKLIDEGADPDSLDSKNWTSLHWAAAGNENPEVITKLINGGADPNSEDLYGRTPLHIAVVQGNRHAIDALIAVMADGETGGGLLGNNSYVTDTPVAVGTELK